MKAMYVMYTGSSQRNSVHSDVDALVQSYSGTVFSELYLIITSTNEYIKMEFVSAIPFKTTSIIQKLK